MANLIKTIIEYAPPFEEVDKSVLGADNKVDFSILAPCPLSYLPDLIHVSINLAVKRLLTEQYRKKNKRQRAECNPFLIMLRGSSSPQRTALKDAMRKRAVEVLASPALQQRLRDETSADFEQALGLVSNMAEFGYLHAVDFANSEWGVKQNAISESDQQGCGGFEFTTAWDPPSNWIMTLSIKNPETEFSVKYASEILGGNAGKYSIKGGVITDETTSFVGYKPGSHGLPYNDMWIGFARSVWGIDELERDMAEAQASLDQAVCIGIVDHTTPLRTR